MYPSRHAVEAKESNPAFQQFSSPKAESASKSSWNVAGGREAVTRRLEWSDVAVPTRTALSLLRGTCVHCTLQMHPLTSTKGLISGKGSTLPPRIKLTDQDTSALIVELGREMRSGQGLLVSSKLFDGECTQARDVPSRPTVRVTCKSVSATFDCVLVNGVKVRTS
ncbi:phosphatidylinositol 3- and 4-kinase [Pseudozyma hubeiensis SY62]|uniref:Phosphatidylinositol 3-and 4-kinase n=1 Tax=Pseudozyma hubeiensis (strain SY62) TaxID=1305764 RepID=R9P2P6_PSEHS|nr:phosphatidylinositol 3- and 4-kinase [Pseudozyma hubeiensis SY62]GAC95606.1 phosphatidylinositol 3- and 4-kinase [Pseudozyma hubeiensis SY62]